MSGVEGTVEGKPGGEIDWGNVLKIAGRVGAVVLVGVGGAFGLDYLGIVDVPYIDFNTERNPDHEWEIPADQYESFGIEQPGEIEVSPEEVIGDSIDVVVDEAPDSTPTPTPTPVPTEAPYFTPLTDLLEVGTVNAANGMGDAVLYLVGFLGESPLYVAQFDNIMTGSGQLWANEAEINGLPVIYSPELVSGEDLDGLLGYLDGIYTTEVHQANVLARNYSGGQGLNCDEPGSPEGDWDVCISRTSNGGIIALVYNVGPEYVPPITPTEGVTPGEDKEDPNQCPPGQVYDPIIGGCVGGGDT